jgi:hypothetical protein
VRRVPDWAIELAVAAALLGACAAAGVALGWTGKPGLATSTRIWPFYLDSWRPKVGSTTVWTVRVLFTLTAGALFMLPLRRWARERESPDWLGLLWLCAGAYAIHFTLGIQRHGFPKGLEHTFSRTGLEYWGDLHFAIDHARTFLADFPHFDAALSQHGATHPPGLTLLLYGLYCLGLRSGPWFEAACSLFAVATALPLYGAARRLTDEPTARFTLPLFLLACSVSAFAILSMDVVTMFFATLALYGLTRALDGERAGGALWGLAFAISTFCSFSMAMLSLTYAIVIASRFDRAGARRRVLAMAMGPLAFVAFYAVLLWGGYRPLYVFRGAADAYAHSDDVKRSRLVSLLGSPIAFIGALGLPVAAMVGRTLGGAIARLGRRAELPAIALIAAALAPPFACIAAGRPRSEVEHVLMPFVPATVFAAAAAARRWYARSFEWLFVAVPLLIAQSIVIEIYLETFW